MPSNMKVWGLQFSFFRDCYTWDLWFLTLKLVAYKGATCQHLSWGTLQHSSVAKNRYYCTAIHLRCLQGSWVRLWLTKESYLTKYLSYFRTLKQWYLTVLFVKLCDNREGLMFYNLNISLPIFCRITIP